MSFFTPILQCKKRIHTAEICSQNTSFFLPGEVLPGVSVEFGRYAFDCASIIGDLRLAEAKKVSF